MLAAPLPVSVRAATMQRSQIEPLLMKVLLPLMTQWSPSSTAVVRIDCRSLPVDGSVIAMAPMLVPAAMPGSQRAFCASVPWCSM